ncbi:MAG: hypothetical protein GY861_19015 [bacterium]|nr:hypothetical protein [bacterium]
MDQLRPHKEQYRLWTDTTRIRVVPAGRRSGKTEIAKRFVIAAALRGTAYPNANFFCAAPARPQAKRIYWSDLKRYSNPRLILNISETELSILYINGSKIFVLGLDKPESVEGTPWDGGILDEYGNMKERTWGENVRPALSDRNGWIWLIGVPEGRNHYYDLYKKAQADVSSKWGAYTWFSADILPEDQIIEAKHDLDELTYQQEYEGSFINFTGRAYYNFMDTTHCTRLSYNPNNELIFCFDFNVDPGVAVVAQEQNYVDPASQTPIVGKHVTGVIGEVFIPKNSNTPAVCRKLINDWGDHNGDISVYGDATGGNRGSAKVQGSDWDLIRQHLNNHYPGRVAYNYGRSNPPERSRISVMNGRLKSMLGDIRLQVDPSKAPHVVKDFEGVALLKGGSGELEKIPGSELSHLTDGLGYYLCEEYPLDGDLSGATDMDGF